LPAPLSDAVIHLSLLGLGLGRLHLSARGQKNEVGRRNVFTSGAVFSLIPQRGCAHQNENKPLAPAPASPLLFGVRMLRVFGVVIGNCTPFDTYIYLGSQSDPPGFDEIETSFFGRVE